MCEGIQERRQPKKKGQDGGQVHDVHHLPRGMLLIETIRSNDTAFRMSADALWFGVRNWVSIIRTYTTVREGGV